MAKQSRDTLKNFFRKGALPSEQQFSDLIESTLNIGEDGFNKSLKNGFEISLIDADHDRLISFFESFESSESGDAVWTVDYDKNNKRLQIKQPESVAAITFSDSGNVGVKNESPVYALDVAGTVASDGRIGGNSTIGENSPVDKNDRPQKTVPADSGWYDITGSLAGCHAFEIMAGVGKQGKGKYALINAVAMNAFNPGSWLPNLLNRKKHIKSQQAYYHSRCDRIELRWKTDKVKPEEYRLQMKTSCDYGDNIKIRYYITQLWFDPTMSASSEQISVDGNEPQD